MNLYEQQPCLYVIKSGNYHDKTLRDKALQNICQQFLEITGISLQPGIVKKKMNALRTQYVDLSNKVSKSKRSGMSTDDIYKPTWWLYEYLSFLKPHIMSRKGESSLQNISCISQEENELQYIDVVRASHTDMTESTAVIEITGMVFSLFV